MAQVPFAARRPLRTSHRNLARAVGVSFCLLALSATSGCGGSRADEDLRQTFEALSDPLAPTAQALSTQLLKILDRESAAALTARATALSKKAGVTVKPFDAFRVLGLPRGVRVGAFEIFEVNGDRGKARITFADLPRAEDDQRVLTDPPAPIEFEVRREDGNWRLHLAALETLGGGTW